MIDFSVFLGLVLLAGWLVLAVPVLHYLRGRVLVRNSELAASEAAGLDHSAAGEADPAPAVCQGCNLANLRAAVDYWRAEAGREAERADFYYAMVAGRPMRRGGPDAR